VNSNYESILKTEQITKKKIVFYKGDVTNKAILEEIFTKYDIEAVIHFAGLKAVGESTKVPLKYYQNNLISTLTLLDVMEKHNVKKMIFSSSATVYGIPDHLPITEDFPLSATNPYGSTKLMIENILKDIYSSDKSWNIALLRYFNPVGAHESGLIGENPNGIPNNLMPYVAQVAVGKLEHVRVFGNDYNTPDGTGVRDYIHIMDLAEGHLAALRNIHKFGADGLNLGTGKGVSVLEMISAFSKAAGHEIPYKIVERRPGDVAATYASAEKAYEMLGWRTTRDVNDMCRDLWRFQQNVK
jgi:UDP-glucose 4-epimerase